MEKFVVRSSELEKLARLAGQPPASIHLIAQAYDHFGLETLATALCEHGAALGALEFALAFPHHPYHHDLRGFDFAVACPHLETLSVGRCRVNASVLLHPTLKQVELRNCWLYTPDPLRLGDPESPASHVAQLTLREVNWGNHDEDLLSHFLGEFRYLNLEKVRHVIKTLGGAVVETASPALTYAVLGKEEYAAYEAGNPSPQVAEIAALAEQGAAVEIVDDDNLRGWIIDGWY
jgi:hypothetical protein